MDAKNEIKIGVRELRSNLSHYLSLAAGGTTVLVTLRDVVVAEIKAPAPDQGVRRRRGGLKGRIWMADDFDALPEDVLQAMESSKF
jgi:antitoxin (DNA-binding transcriptional repressor) of toxin-antitoxin stability system